MRICLIATDFPTASALPADNSYVFQLACGLKASGADLEVITLSEGQPQAEEIAGIIVHRVPIQTYPAETGLLASSMPNSKYLFAATEALWKQFAKRHGQKPFDLVDSPEELATAILPGITKACPLVVRTSNTASPRLESNKHKSAFAFDDNFAALLKNSGLLMAQAVICENEGQTFDPVHNLNYPARKVHVVANQGNSDLAKKTLEIYSECLKSSQNANPGARLYRKGPDKMIEDADSLYMLVDRMLYDLFYQYSFRFRLKHWWQMCKANPQAFIARLACKFGRSGSTANN